MASKYEVEYTITQRGHQFDVCLLVDGRPRAFRLCGTEVAARREGRDMVRRARENIARGRVIDDRV